MTSSPVIRGRVGWGQATRVRPPIADRSSTAGTPLWSSPSLPSPETGEEVRQASRYQFGRSQVLLSQPVSSTTSLLLAAATPRRATTGITTVLLVASSFNFIN